MKKKIFFYVVFTKYTKKKQSDLTRYLNYLKKITPEDSDLFLLDFSKYYFGESFNKSNFSIKNIKYLKVENLYNFKKFCYGKKIYCFGLINQKIKKILILRIIKKLNFKVIEIMNLGYFPQSYKEANLSLLYKIFVLLTYRTNYYFFRILSLLNLTPKIDYYFESSQNRINKIKSRQEKKFLNIFSSKKIAFFKKIIRINSQLHEKLEKPVKISKKYIVYIDSGYDHPDITTKELYMFSKKRRVFYDNLYKSLENIEKKFNKKLVFCKHPKSNYPAYFNKFDRRFIISTGKAEYYILNSFLSIVSATTLINLVIYYKKDFIISNSQFWGNLVKDKIVSIKKELNLETFDIESDKYANKLQLEKKILKNRKQMNKFISNNLIADKKTGHMNQMKRFMGELS